MYKFEVGKTYLLFKNGEPTNKTVISIYPCHNKIIVDIKREN